MGLFNRKKKEEKKELVDNALKELEGFAQEVAKAIENLDTRLRNVEEVLIGMIDEANEKDAAEAAKTAKKAKKKATKAETKEEKENKEENAAD